MSSRDYYSEKEEKPKEEKFIVDYENIFANYAKSPNHPSLEDALKEMYSSLDNKKRTEIINEIKDKSGDIIDKNWKEIKKKYPEITEEEATIISSYTCDCEESDYSPYKILNDNLNSENREKGIQQVSKYFFILLCSLRKLERYTDKCLYRYINKKIDLKNYNEGQTKYFYGFISISQKNEQFKSGTIFSLNGNLIGYDISLFNIFRKNEILLEPERKYKIEKIENEKNDNNEIINIICQAVDSPQVLEDIIKTNKKDHPDLKNKKSHEKNNIKNEYEKEKRNKHNIESKNKKFYLLLVKIIIPLFVVVFIHYYLEYIRKKNTIIGIDFGSSYSGFTIIENGIIDFRKDESKSKLISTELLMYNPTSKVLSIGKKEYNLTDLVKNSLSKFRNFKKNLDPINNNYYVNSSMPQGPEAITVPLKSLIQGFLEVLRDDYIINNKMVKGKKMDEIKWVLTVPALWDEKGKKFMKEIACKALLKEISCEKISDKLVIALEQEAASLAILYDENIKNKLTKGKSFLLVDAGGYSVDFTANQIIDDNYNLKQLSIPKSYAFGSNLINEKIINVIEYIYGENKIDKTKNNKYSDWEAVLNEIEDKKLKIDEVESEQFKIQVRFMQKTWCLGTIIRNDCKYDYNGVPITYNSDFIYIPISFIKNIIYELSLNITTEIKDQIENINEKIDLVIITGGFSNSKILQNNIKNHIKNSIDLVFLDEPQETVMKGASIFGLKSNKILYKMIPVTIGIETYEKCKNGEIKCINDLIIISKGDSIRTNKIIKKNIYPVSEKITFYYSNNKYYSLKKFLGQIELPSEHIPFENKKIKIYIKFTNSICVKFSKNDDNWKYFDYP